MTYPALEFFRKKVLVHYPLSINNIHLGNFSGVSILGADIFADQTEVDARIIIYINQGVGRDAGLTAQVARGDGW